MTYSSATILIMVINGVAIPFRIIIPVISDRIGPLNMTIPVVFIWTIVSFCWLAVKTTGGYYAFVVFYGAATGSFQSLTPTTVASITPRLDKVGTRMGMAFALVSFSSMTGPPVGGALQKADGGGFVAPQIWAACSTLVGFVLFLGARWAKAGLSFHKKC